jgi:hypothetical protein
MKKPQLVSIWTGNSFYVKTYRDGDGYYYSVMMSPDFATKREADAFNNEVIQFFKGNLNG